MASLAEIETATKRYADRRGLLALKVERLNDRIEALKRDALPAIKSLAADTANAKSTLEALVKDSKALFVKPKTIIISGITVGFRKGTGKMVFDDEELVIKRVKKLFLKEDDRETYIKTTEKLRGKTAFEELDAATLKKLGITIEGTGDILLIKAVGSDVDKIVSAILKESAEEPELEAA